METLLQFFIYIPLAGFIISLIINEKKETALSRTAFFTVGLHMVAFWGYTVYWMLNNHATLNLKEIILFKTAGYEFFIDFCFDKITVVYMFVGSLLTFLVTVYSRYYLHREEGYKRFFNALLLFYFGYNLVVLSGNLETLFMGWEVLGISSFLLIAFYRDRYLPVKNAVKVFTIYRIGDVGLIIAMWMSHHLWHENITFIKLSNYELVSVQLQNHTVIGVILSLMILLTAAGKSAQLPFSSWLPRAMEGPTPSSAIFYGSLSIHLGVFLLIRTFPFWEHQFSVRIIIGLTGLVTSIVTSLIARVQSSVKSQIAYGSIAQIGIIFIEVAAGFENLALFHFAGNAFLRTYQLLVSPSVVSYLIREQFYNFIPRKHSIEDSLPKRIEYSIYMLSLKEWNLDAMLYRFLWNPLKSIGHKLDFLTLKRVIIFFIPAYIVGLVACYYEVDIPGEINPYLPALFSLIGLLMVFKAFTERKNVTKSWILIIMNHFWVALAISFNEHFKYADNLLYLSGIVVSGAIGYFCLQRLKSFEKVDLTSFYGHSYEHPKLAFLFLICSLGLTGFPITTTFIGEDLIFTHIHEDQILLAFFTSLSFIIDSIAVIRIFARVFLGPHVKTYHEVAYRSS